MSIAAPSPTNASFKRTARKMTLSMMITATYFMVAGGPYGLEDLIGKTGYSTVFAVLLLTPLLWSLPTALMVSELATALPEEGGFYVWVSRAMGPFWGFQESWLTLAGSIFDMALYPTLVIGYLGRFAPQLTAGHRAWFLELAMILACVGWNVLGAHAVGEGSLLLNVLLLSPFAVIVVLGLIRPAAAAPPPSPIHADLLGGIAIAMWNYMGWDNLSTIAGEVDRPQRMYPLAMVGSLILVEVSYLLPVAAVAHARLDMRLWSTGGWVDAGRVLGGPALAAAVTAAAIIGGIGTFGTLMLSLTRLPAVMAADGYLPRALTRVRANTGAPWVSIIVCAVAWAVCLPLGFVSLLIIDVLLTGSSIVLEFCALVALRIREPLLPRPYRVPGGLVGAAVVGIPPLALVILSLVRSKSQQVGGTNELIIALGIMALGVVCYGLSLLTRRHRARASLE
jgi:amino acid transporter